MIIAAQNQNTKLLKSDRLHRPDSISSNQSKVNIEYWKENRTRIVLGRTEQIKNETGIAIHLKAFNQKRIICKRLSSIELFVQCITIHIHTSIAINSQHHHHSLAHSHNHNLIYYLIILIIIDFVIHTIIIHHHHHHLNTHRHAFECSALIERILFNLSFRIVGTGLFSCNSKTKRNRAASTNQNQQK